MLVEPRQLCRFEEVLRNCAEAAAAWKWSLVLVHGRGAVDFWENLRRHAVPVDVPVVYHELHTENFRSGDEYSDFLKKPDFWLWLQTLRFTHVVLTQTDVIINPSKDIRAFVEAYDYIGCRTKWSDFQYPPPLRAQRLVAANGGFSLRSVELALQCTMKYPANKTNAWPKRKPLLWLENHEDVYFLWGVWQLGGGVPTGISVEKSWCNQKRAKILNTIAVHKPRFSWARLHGGSSSKCNDTSQDIEAR